MIVQEIDEMTDITRIGAKCMARDIFFMPQPVLPFLQRVREIGRAECDDVLFHKTVIQAIGRLSHARKQRSITRARKRT